MDEGIEAAPRPVHIAFLYPDDAGQPELRELVSWSESEWYVRGFCLTKRAIRSFRKDKVLGWTEGSADAIDVRVPTGEAPPPPRPRRMVKTGYDILFTGFGSTRDAELRMLAVAAGFRPRSDATRGLAYICGGKTAGPAKMKRAALIGAAAITEEQCLLMFETGEYPD